MLPQPAPAASVAPSLRKLEAAANALLDSALSAHDALAEHRAAAAREGAQAVLVAAYCRRLQRLASLLQQYDAHLQRTLAKLGLVQHVEYSKEAACQAAHEVAAALQELQDQLMAAVLCSTSVPPPRAEDLLELASSSGAPESLAVAGAPALLAALQGELAAGMVRPTIDCPHAQHPSLRYPQMPCMHPCLLL